MLIAEDEQGIVCINGKPVYDHYREHGLDVSRGLVLAIDKPTRISLACIAGLLIVIKAGDVRTAQAVRLNSKQRYDYLAADLAGLEIKQLDSLEAGWCGYGPDDGYARYDPHFCNLGFKAYQQCIEALQPA